MRFEQHRAGVPRLNMLPDAPSDAYRVFMIVSGHRYIIGRVAALLAALTLAQGIAAVPMVSAASAGVTGVWTVLCVGGEMIFVPLGGEEDEAPHAVPCPIAALGPATGAAGEPSGSDPTWAPYRPEQQPLWRSADIALAIAAMPRGPPRD